MNITLIAIDIAKNVFQVCCVNAQGRILQEKRLTRKQLVPFIRQHPGCRIAMEACGSANYWARTFKALGNSVDLIAPQFVKPFVKGNKNDKQDARAIAEAAQRPTMRYVEPKSVDQQDMQSLLRIRNGYVQMRIKASNQLRGVLAEYGIIASLGLKSLKKQLTELLAPDADNGLSQRMKSLIEMQYTTLLFFEERIEICEVDIQQIASANEACQRLQTIDGIGPITAVALVAQAGNGAVFKNGRHFSAFLGLVPRQHSSGTRQQLQGISKRGDSYLRELLIHGARSVLQHADKKQTSHRQWAKQLAERVGFNKAAVALANKNARIAMSLLKQGGVYQAAA